MWYCPNEPFLSFSDGNVMVKILKCILANFFVNLFHLLISGCGADFLSNIIRSFFILLNRILLMSE